MDNLNFFIGDEQIYSIIIITNVFIKIILIDELGNWLVILILKPADILYP